jgi:hypothetical protein
MNYIWAVNLGIRTRAGHHIHVAVDVLRYSRGWLIATHQSVPFAVPVVWREQMYHLTECYCCLTKTDGHNSKPKHTRVYPNIPSAIRPVKRDISL